MIIKYGNIKKKYPKVPYCKYPNPNGSFQNLQIGFANVFIQFENEVTVPSCKS